MFMDSANRMPSLTQFVRRYRICWEVWPELLVRDNKQRQVGFELELSGSHDFEGHHSGPGCSGCRQVFLALHAVVEHILPPEGRPSRYEIGPYEQALRYSAVRGNRPDVTLTVKVLHRQGFDQPVDPCEVRCLEEMKARLRELGACERQWSYAQKARA
jgi:hypothetical protein